MIGWKVGWVVGPESVMADVAKAHIYNSACPVGIAQTAAAVALDTVDDDFDIRVAEWQTRRDTIIENLGTYPIVPAAGGWSMLLDVGRLGLDSVTASKLLMERGKIAATFMRNWGQENGDRFVRLVFSNEPVQRLADIGQRFRAAFNA